MEKLITALNDGLDSGLTVSEIKEILLQLYACAGFPRSLNGINAFMEVMEERKKKGIKNDPGKEPGALAGMEVVTAQLHAHFGIALNIGLTESELKHLITVLGEKVGQKEADDARAVLNKALGREDAKGPFALNTSDGSVIFPRGERIPEPYSMYFVGTACLCMLVTGGNEFNCPIGDKMIAADVIVMATPVYFYTMNGQMKTLIDRTCSRYTEIKDKEFYFIMTAAEYTRQAMQEAYVMGKAIWLQKTSEKCNEQIL